MQAFWDSAWGWAVKLTAWIMVFLAPVKATVAAVIFLALGDIVTGIWASFRRGEKFSSSKLRNKPLDLIAYLFGIILSHTAEQVLLPEIPLVKVVAGLIASVELTSALENLSSITGIPLGDLVRKIFERKKDE